VTSGQDKRKIIGDHSGCFHVVKGGALLTELNYSLLSWVILFNILEMADVETADNFATSVKGILNSFANRSAIPERTRGILPRRLP
jgi:hypothetical protein